MALTLPPNRGPDAAHREVSPYPDEEQRLQLLRKPFRVEELYAALDKALSSGESGQRTPDGAAANTTTTAPVDGKAASFQAGPWAVS